MLFRSVFLGLGDYEGPDGRFSQGVEVGVSHPVGLGRHLGEIYRRGMGGSGRYEGGHGEKDELFHVIVSFC